MINNNPKTISMQSLALSLQRPLGAPNMFPKECNEMLTVSP
jgi:hypothetical protein